MANNATTFFQGSGLHQSSGVHQSNGNTQHTPLPTASDRRTTPVPTASDRRASSPHPGSEGCPLRINVTAPVTRFGVGPISFDPVAKLIGAPLAHILEPLMAGEIQRRPSPAGPSLEVFPLALPEGEGATLSLGHWGELGFRAERGYLRLTVPLPVAGWVRERLGPTIVYESNGGLSLDRGARVADFWIRLTPGMRAAIPLGLLGELGVEAA